MKRSRSRGRSSYRTPRTQRRRRNSYYIPSTSRSMSVRRGRSMSRSPATDRTRSTISNLLDVAYDVSGGNYVRAGIGAARAGYNAMQSRGRGVKRSFYGNSSNGGTVKPYQKYSRKKYKKNGKLSQYHMELKGATVAFEHRGSFNNANAEAVAIGHTSLPARLASLQMWRAVFKKLMIKMNVHLKDYSENMLGRGFGAGDAFAISYYPNSDSMTITSNAISLSNLSTFDDVPNALHQLFANGQWDNARLSQFVYLPSLSAILPNTISRYSTAQIDLNTMKISVHTTSHLKIQNITIEDPEDGETVDVTSVPLQGKLFHCKGNNVLMKSNRQHLPGFTNNDETTIAQSYERLTGIQNAGVNEAHYNNGSASTFSRPAEVPKPWEIKNYISHSYATVAPGEIKHSYLKQQFQMSIQTYFEILYNKATSTNTATNYNERLGKTNCFWLEKVVGRPVTVNNGINLWFETEVRQTVMCHGYESEFTLPITYQLNL